MPTEINLTETEKAYIAGIIDGEGYVGLGARSGDATGGYSLPMLQIGMTNIPVIDWLAQRLPKCGRTIRKSTEKHKECHILCWRSSKAADILLTVLPYLVAKAKQAELVIQANILITQYPIGGKCNPVPTEIRNQRADLFIQTKALNKRGIEDHVNS